jgi:enamine deaminase RidA (YjgF/YER057c/UK114 family)
VAASAGKHGARAERDARGRSRQATETLCARDGCDAFVGRLASRAISGSAPRCNIALIGREDVMASGVRHLRTATAFLLGVSLCEVSAMASSKQAFRAGPDLGLPFSTAVRSGDFVYASGVLATDASGKVVPGDIREQTRRALDNLKGSFAAAGTRLENAAAIHVYLTRAADFAAMNEVYRTYWPKDPPTRTTVVTGLVAPEALIEIAGVAVREGAERTAIHPKHWAPSPNPYSYGIRSGDTLFVSGLISRNGKDNAVVTGDMETQTRTVLANAAEILAAGGMKPEDVVSARVYITDTAGFQAMNEAYRRFFPSDPPARATVKAQLTRPEYLVEVTLVAVKDASRRVVTTPRPDGSPGQPNPNLSSAVRVGNRLYVSGMLGNTPETAGDARAQARETFVRIGRTLEAAGFAWTDVVDGIVYLTDAAAFPALNEAYREVFKADFPARATVLSGLVAPDGLVEIMFVASK